MTSHGSARDRLALATAGFSAGYAAVLAYMIRITNGPATDSPLDSWSLTIAVLLHVALVIFWCLRPAISRRAIVGIGVIEVVVGVTAFFTSWVFLGRPSMSTESMTSLRGWLIFGLPVAGLFMIVAGVLHSGSRESAPE